MGRHGAFPPGRHRAPVVHRSPAVGRGTVVAGAASILLLAGVLAPDVADAQETGSGEPTLCDVLQQWGLSTLPIREDLGGTALCTELIQLPDILQQVPVELPASGGSGTASAVNTNGVPGTNGAPGANGTNGAEVTK